MADKVEELIKKLKNDNWFVTRRAAAKALGKIGDTRAVKPLIKALEDENWDVRKAAAEALEKLGEPLGWLVYKTLEGEEKALKKLVKRKDPRAVDILNKDFGV